MHKNECHYHGSMNSTDEVEDKYLYKEIERIVHKLFNFNTFLTFYVTFIQVNY